MEPELLIQFFSQLGASGVLLWMLLDERKARQNLETRVFTYLEDERDAQHDQPRTKLPSA